MGGVTAHVVDQDQALRAVAVFKKPANAPFLAQAAKEIEIGFVVLRLVIALGVGFDQTFFNGKVIVGQERIEQLNHGLVLKDFAVSSERGQMQPRAQR